MEATFMRYLPIHLVVCAAILTLTTGIPARAQSQGARAAIEAAGTQFSAAFKAGDAAGMAALYTEDAIAFPPNSQAVRGRAAIQKLWQDFINSEAKEVTLKTMEVEETGKTAYETGTAVVKDATGKVLDEANYVVVWKQVGGKWMLHRDIWNSKMPPATAAGKKTGS
jgi:uncharacterized protein (TIGR02246 family)